MNIDGEHIEANASAQRIGGAVLGQRLNKDQQNADGETVRQKGCKIFRRRRPKLAPNTAPLSSKLAVILRIAFFRMVIKNGNICRLMTCTKPPKEKNPSEKEPVMGTSC